MTGGGKEGGGELCVCGGGGGGGWAFFLLFFSFLIDDVKTLQKLIYTSSAFKHSLFRNTNVKNEVGDFDP